MTTMPLSARAAKKQSAVAANAVFGSQDILHYMLDLKKKDETYYLGELDVINLAMTTKSMCTLRGHMSKPLAERIVQMEKDYKNYVDDLFHEVKRIEDELDDVSFNAQIFQGSYWFNHKILLKDAHQASALWREKVRRMGYRFDGSAVRASVTLQLP